MVTLQENLMQERNLLWLWLLTTAIVVGLFSWYVARNTYCLAGNCAFWVKPVFFQSMR